jgi:CRISPR-associated protein Csm4
MKTFKCTLVPTSPFATEFRGDSLFGQLCWALCRIYSDLRLKDLLDGYTSKRPFLVVGDPLPAGCLPRPALPIRLMLSENTEKNIEKNLKKAPYLLEEAVHLPSSEWLDKLCHNPKEGCTDSSALVTRFVRMSNSISRITGTTGEGAMFAPRAQDVFQYQSGSKLDCVVKFDEKRLTLDELKAALQYVGARGYGKRSSVGFGQFNVESITEIALLSHKEPNALLTLSRSLPGGIEINQKLSMYNTCTHFGRHGDELAHGQVFKKPILMLESGAVIVPEGNADALHAIAKQGWIGRAAGGRENPISEQMPETVHQGYAPVVPVCISWERIDEH